MLAPVKQDRPRFRQDLIAELIEEGGARFVEVASPDSDNVYRFYEVEYSIACAMDGQRDVAGIVKWAQEELGVTPSPAEVQMVISTLADLRFIGDDRGAVAADAKVAKAAPTQPEPTIAAKAPDADLARGVVAGANAPRSPAPPAADVELGASGAKPPAKSADLPKAFDFDLGAPGAPSVAAPPRAPVEDIALGAPGSRGEPSKPKAPASEIGMDLSAHMGVGTDDVKEAVRKSKAMSAVDVPKELLEAEAPKPAPEKQPVAKPAEPQAAKGSEKTGKGKTDAEKQAQSERDKKAAAEKKTAAAAKAEQDDKGKQAAKAAAADTAPETAAVKKADKAVEKTAEKTADKKADKAKPAVELPKRPSADRPVAPPAPAGGVSPVLVVLLILAIVGAGTFFVWKFVLSEPETTSQKQPVTPPKPLPPPPPVDVTSRLGAEPQAPQVVKAPVAGTIETIEAADKEVKAGDVVATLAGGKPLTTEIANLTKQIETATPAIDAATKALEEAQQKPDNAAAVTAAQAKVGRLKKPLDEKQATLEKKKADLDKLQVKATADGKLADVAKVGQKVAVDETIASVARPSLIVASFKVPPGTKMAADGNLSVVTGDKTIVCTVIDAQAETVKVSCPPDGLAEGADVKFTLPK